MLIYDKIYGQFKLLLLFFSMIFILGIKPLSAEILIPTMDNPVVDRADVFSSAEEDKIKNSILQFEQTTGQKILVVSINDLQGLHIEKYAKKLMVRWNYGYHGILLMVAPKVHQARIAVSSDLRHTYPHSLLKQIMNATMMPYFKAKDYSGGVLESITQLDSYYRVTKNAKHQELDSFDFKVLTKILVTTFLIVLAYKFLPIENRFYRITIISFVTAFVIFFIFKSHMIAIEAFIIVFVLLYLSRYSFRRIRGDNNNSSGSSGSW